MDAAAGAELSTGAAVDGVRESLARVREMLVGSTMTPWDGAAWIGYDLELGALVPQVLALEAVAAAAVGEAAALELLPVVGA